MEVIFKRVMVLVKMCAAVAAGDLGRGGGVKVILNAFKFKPMV